MAAVSDPDVMSPQLVLQTTNPYDLVPRVFDFARKGSIVLDNLEAALRADGQYEVRFVFLPCDPDAFQTLTRRAELIQSALVGV